MTTHYHQTPTGPVAFTSDEEAALAAYPTAGDLTILKGLWYAYVNQLCDKSFYSTIGNRWPEYALAEADSRAYKAAGYAGTVPTTVSDYATISGTTAHVTADAIIAEADSRNTAMADLRKHRLQALSDISTASDISGIATTVNTFNTYIVGFTGIPAT